MSAHLIVLVGLVGAVAMAMVVVLLFRVSMTYELRTAHQYCLLIITAVSMRVRVERKHTNQIHAESKCRYEQKALCLDLLRLEEPLDALHEDEEGDKHQKDGINEA